MVEQDKKFPSKRYFELVKTKEDYLLLLSTGLGYEVEPYLPNSWEEHLKIIKELENK